MEKTAELDFIDLLQLLFLGLKLAGSIEWSWWLVLAPMLARSGFVAAVFIVAAIRAMVEAKRRRAAAR
jgi:hypothetical protein